MARRVVTVFGGSGFLGRHVVRRLAAGGAVVRVAGRDSEAAQYLKPIGEVGQIVAVPTDIANPTDVAKAVEGAYAVINLVGILYEWGRQTFDRVHREGAETIAKAAKAAGVARLVHVSALGCAADSPAAYARSKAAGEAAVRAAFPEATILRPSVVFGPEDSFFNRFAGIMRFTPMMPVFGCPVIPKIKLFPAADELFDIDLYGKGGTRMQPVFVGDVAEAAARSIQDPVAVGKTFELGGPRVYSFKELMELLLKVTERSRFLAPIPFGLARFYAWFIEKLPNPLMTRDQLRMLEKDNVVTPGAFGLAELGITPTPAETVLPTYLRRFRLPKRQRARLA